MTATIKFQGCTKKEGHGFEPWPSVLQVEGLVDILNCVVNVELARRGG